MPYVGYADQPTQQAPPTADQLAASFNPGSFGGGYGAVGPPQAPAYGQDVQGLNAFYNLYNSAVLGPSNAIAGQQIGSLQDQMALVGASGGLQSQIAQQQAGFGLQGVGLQREQLGVRQAALARQMELLPQQFGLQQQQYDLSTKEAWQNAQQAQWSNDSSATARGAFTSVGANRNRDTIQKNLANSLQGIGIERQGSQLNFNEQMAQEQDSQKMLGISAKQLGLSEEEIRARLQNSLDQIGISSQMSVDQLLSELYKVQQGQISPLASLFGDIYGLSGITVPSGG